jgi:putative transposase
VRGIQVGATENAAAVKQLFTNLREQGLPTDRKYLFVVDGAKVLRAAIDEVFGAEQPVQRCRNHKMRNVIDELPKERQPQALNLMRAAWRVSDADKGVKRMEQLARFLEHEHESAARSLREGMAEMFTVQRRSFPHHFTNAWEPRTSLRVPKAAFKRERIT